MQGVIMFSLSFLDSKYVCVLSSTTKNDCIVSLNISQPKIVIPKALKKDKGLISKSIGNKTDILVCHKLNKTVRPPCYTPKKTHKLENCQGRF